MSACERSSTYTEKLGFLKLFASWIEKEQKMCSGRAFLDRHRQDGVDLFSHILAGVLGLRNYEYLIWNINTVILVDFMERCSTNRHVTQI